MVKIEVLIADCETDGFLDTYTRIWCIQIGTADGNDVTVYADHKDYPPLSEGLSRLRSADRIVMHNGIKFDMEAINRLYPNTIRLEQIYDTLIAVRLYNPEERANALGDWGLRLGVAKGDYSGDFQQFDDELVRYAKQDIVVTRALYHHVEPRLRDWGSSLDLEHRVAFVIALQERNGFRLNVDKAVALEGELRQEMMEIERELQEIFPPIYVQDKTKGSCAVTPKVNNKTTGVTNGCPYSKVKVQEFNPGSEMQIELRLRLKYGWKPRAFTATGRAKVDETVLAALPYVECKPLLRYLRVTKILGQLSDGDNGWLKLVKPNGRVHGAVNTIGCASNRMSHFKPNMAQVDKKEPRMREVWEPRPGWVLLGCDGEGVQARMLAHYMSRYDKGKLSKVISEGRKEDKTDVHSVNFKALVPLGMPSRDGAKTILYALLFGAGNPRLGWTLKEACRDAGSPVPKVSDKELGARIRQLVAVDAKSYEALCEDIVKTVRRTTGKKTKGYLKGLDGRRIFIRSEHSSLVFLLQAGEAVVMKLALCIFHFEYAQSFVSYGDEFAYCANVHDEVQIECHPDFAEEIGKSFSDAIAEAGRRLKVRCPLAGAFSIGKNWKDTH